VTHEESRRPQVVLPPLGGAALPAPQEPGPIVLRSRFDMLCRDVTSIALTAGTMSLLVLLLLVTVSVMLAAAAGAPRVDRVISAWIWVILLCVLVLPTWGVLRLPWHDSALRPYTELVKQSEENRESLSASVGFLLLAGVCMLGAVIAFMRYCAGVRSLVAPDEHRLDPALEAEAANIKPGTLHGGRSATALRRVVPADAPSPAHGVDRRPAASAVSPGTFPRRLV
jgi:hypothetical protein